MPAPRASAASTLIVAALWSATTAASPPAQPPNPLPRGVFDDAPAFDPAADDVDDVDDAPLPAPALGSTDPAGDARVRLIYAPGPWATVCPAAADVPALVRQHLGRDPFGEPATRVALIALDGDGDVPIRARVELLDLALEPIGSRVVDAGDGCSELVATAAFQLALALDPLAAAAGPPVAPPVTPAGPTAPPTPEAVTTPVPPTSPPAASPAPEQPAPTADDTELFVSAGAGVAALLSPEGVMAGLQVGLGGRWAAVSARLEGRVDVSGENRGTTSVPILLSAVPCAHLPVLDLGVDGAFEASGCLTATAGVMPAIGVFTGFGLYAGSGLRLALDWHIPGEVTMRAFGQVEAAGVRPLLLNLSTGNLYQSPAFNVLLGVAMDIPWT